MPLRKLEKDPVVISAHARTRAREHAHTRTFLSVESNAGHYDEHGVTSAAIASD